MSKKRLSFILFILVAALLLPSLFKSATAQTPSTPLLKSADQPSSSAVNWGNVKEIDRIRKMTAKNTFLRFDKMGKPVPKTISHPLDLNGKSFLTPQNYVKNAFRGEVSFLLARFLKPADFTLADFNSSVNFANAEFNDNARFTWVIFNKAADFSHAEFYGKATFYRTLFNLPATFYKASFNKYTRFVGSQFKEPVNFRQTNFKETVDFSDACFQKKANFSRANFRKAAIFSNATFNDVLDLSDANFWGSLDFSHATFKKIINFHGASLPPFLDFSNTRLHEMLDLTDTRPNEVDGITQINLVGSDPAKLKFHYQHFQLYFPPHTSEKVINSVYEEVMGSFEKNHFEKSYQMLYIEKMQRQYKLQGKNFLNFAQKHWWNYGFDKEKIFFWIIAILLVLTFINNIFYEHDFTHALCFLFSLL